MLAHFKPFYLVLLIGENKSIKSTYNDLAFPENLKLIIKNWEEICECEDEREADWWQKKTALAKESQALTHSMVFYHDDEIIDASSEILTEKKEFEINSIPIKLLKSNWLKKRIFITYSNRV